MFGPDEIQAAITKTLGTSAAQIPDGHTTALVTVFDGKTANVTVAKKIGDHWQADSTVAYDLQDHHVSGGIQIHASW